MAAARSRRRASRARRRRSSRPGRTWPGIGGFSGCESEVSVAWLADMVRAGKIRWVLTHGSGGGFRDGRTGAAKAMNAVAQTCTPVGTGLYDCPGRAEALATVVS